MADVWYVILIARTQWCGALRAPETSDVVPSEDKDHGELKEAHDAGMEEPREQGRART